MRRRKLVITLAAAALFGVLVVPASAELHRVTVTLVTGQKVTLTVDVPPGTPVESIQIPGLPAPVQSIADLGPVSHRRRPPPPPRASPRARPAETPSQTATPVADRAPAATTTPARAGTRAATSRAASRAPTQQPNRLDPNAEALTGELEQPADERAEPQVDATEPDPQHRRLADARQPDRLARRAGRRPASASRTSSSRSSASRRSCSRSTRPPASSTACAGRSSRRSTRSRPTTAATSTSPPPARSAGCSSCPRRGTCTASTATRTASRIPYNPVDAIFAAARYLRAAGADTDLRARDLRLQPRRLVRRLRHPARALHRRAAGRPRRLALRADAGPLPGPGQGDVREGGPAQGPQDAAPARTRPTWSSPAATARASRSSPSRAPRSSP